MELYEALKIIATALVGIFGFVASADKVIDIYRKYKGFAQAPDKAQDKQIGELRQEVELLKNGYLRIQEALSRDLARFGEIDNVNRLLLEGVCNLLDAQLTGNNRAAMTKSKSEILEYLMKGATNHGSDS